MRWRRKKNQRNNDKPVLIWDIMSENSKKNCDHKVNETHLRSILKGITARILEITIDTLILSHFMAAELGLGLSITVEGTCFILSFINERLWNKIAWGRQIKDIEQPRNGKVIYEFCDDAGNTYAVIDWGKYKEVALILANEEVR